MFKIKRLLELVLIFSILCGHGLAAESSASLRYDDGLPEDGMWIASNRGHAVLFTPPSENWTLSKTEISGRINPDSDQNMIILEIWDQNLNLLYSRAEDPKSYFGEEMAWAEFDVPDIPLSSSFYVCLFEFSNVYVGADLSNRSSDRSFVVSRNPNRIDSWNLPYPRNETDWSIRALGRSSAPVADLDLKSTQEAVIIEAMITDPDSDLARASIQVADDESLDVLWSEQRLIEGGEAKLTFNWPFEMFQMNNGTVAFEPIFAFNTIGVSPERETYMAHLVPCILKLTPEGPGIEAAAYFGDDGEFHALIDTNGFTHYMSRELLLVVQPQSSYGDYVKNNVTLKDGVATLSFFSLNAAKGMAAYPPLLLARSPLHHYKLRLNKVAVSRKEYIIELSADDSAGNQRKVKERISS